MLLTGWSGNTGTLGVFLAMSSFFLLSYKIKKIPILFILVILLMLMTRSITAVLSFTIGSLFFFKKSRPLTLIICGIILIFSIFIKPIGINRIDIWYQVLCHIWNHPIIGQGIGRLSELGILDKGTTPVFTAHNEFLEITQNLGIIGIILFVGFIIKKITFFLRQKNNDIQLAMISSLIAYLTSSLFWFSMHLAQLSFYAIIIWACLEYSYESVDKNSEVQ